MLVLSIIVWIVSILMLLLSIVYFYIQKRLCFWSDAEIPHIAGSLPSGSLKDIGTKYHMAEQLQIWYNKFKMEGIDYAGLYFFFNPVILAMDCDLIKTILVKDFNHFMDRQIYYNERDDPLSAHLAALQGTRWKNLRSKLTPTFTSGKLKGMVPIVVGVADEFRKVLAETIKKDDILDMRDVLGRFTTDVIGSCAFGIDCNSLKDPNGEFRKFGKKSAEQSRHSTVIVLLMTTFKRLANFFRMKLILDDVSDFFLGAIRNTIEVREKNNIKRNDFMNMLIELKNNGKLEGEQSSFDGCITFEELAAQAFVFFGAGFETSSTTLSYALYELSLNHDLQNRAREEVFRALEKYDGVMSHEAVVDMKYIEQIINETLRKYPPAATINRVMTSDQYKMPGTNQIIKKGQHVIIPTYAIHHDADYFPDPERYDPNRFSDEESKNRTPYSYLPFGDGPRSCIGLRFGMIQAKVGLASLLRDFKFHKCTKSVYPMIFNPKQHILMPKDGMWLKVEKYN